MMAIVKRRRWMMIGLYVFATAAVDETIAFLPGWSLTEPLSTFEQGTAVGNSKPHSQMGIRRVGGGPTALPAQLSDISTSATDDDSSKGRSGKKERPLSSSAQLASIWKTIQLVGASLVFSTILIAWEDVSTTHPLRANISMEPRFGSTVRGLAFGANERQRVPLDMEPEQSRGILSFNEVSFQHRARVSTWSQSISREDVERSVRTIQLALLRILECERMATNYEWEDLTKSLLDPIITTQLDEACDILNRATEFLSLDVRSEVGFDFGSCAWRHCGAFADVREAVDELDSLVGILGTFT
jgi:hypothetical protein